MDTPRVTGPTHPLIAAHRRDKARWATQQRHLRETAAQILRDHRLHAESTQSVFRLADSDDGRVRADHIGPLEHNQGLATQRGYLVVSDRDLAGKPTDPDRMTATGHGLHGSFATRWEKALDHIAAQLAGYQPDRYLPLIRAAYETAPKVALMLAIGTASGHLVWDSGETISAAALRLALDGAWEISGYSSYHHTADEVLHRVRDTLGQTRPMEDFAADYLAHRGQITADLTGLDVEIGGELLDTYQVAALAKVTPSTLRGYISRATAPEPDEGAGSRSPRWRQVTVTAWLLTRSRPTAG